MGSDQKRGLIAVLISGVFLFGWQKFFAPLEESKILLNDKTAHSKITETERSKKISNEIAVAIVKKMYLKPTYQIFR